MPSKHQKTRVRILVKAFPQHSQKYEETVCCAGITDQGRLIRLFPITYRRLAPENQFDRFDLIEATLTKASSDARPESFRVDHDSIRVIERGSKLSDGGKVLLLQPHVAPSLERCSRRTRPPSAALASSSPMPGACNSFIVRPRPMSGRT